MKFRTTVIRSFVPQEEVRLGGRVGIGEYFRREINIYLDLVLWYVLRSTPPFLPVGAPPQTLHI